MKFSTGICFPFKRRCLCANDHFGLESGSWDTGPHKLKRTGAKTQKPRQGERELLWYSKKSQICCNYYNSLNLKRKKKGDLLVQYLCYPQCQASSLLLPPISHQTVVSSILFYYDQYRNLPLLQKICVPLIEFFFSFLVVLGFEIRAAHLLVRYLLSHSTSAVLCWVFSRSGLGNYLPGLTFE